LDAFQEVIARWTKLASKALTIRDQSTTQFTFRFNDGSSSSFIEGDLNDLYYSISGSHEQNALIPIQEIQNLFKRPWWSRTWVLQELSLARKACFVCGNKVLSRRRCIAAFYAICALGLVLNNNFTLRRAISTPYQLSVASASLDGCPNTILGMSDTQKHAPLSLLALLHVTCLREVKAPVVYRASTYFEATDPRDKVYGILGLTIDKDELKDLGVRPDYTQSCQDAYICAATALLKQGHISILSLVQFPKNQNALPSWVPDWSNPRRVTLQEAESADHITLKPEYKACGSLN
jgi:hypothetical protein